MFCPNCGNQLADNAKFCPSCGSPTRSDQPAPAPQLQPTQAPADQAAANYAPQQPSYTAQPTTNETFAAAGAQAAAAGAQAAAAGMQAVSAAKATIKKTPKFKNPFFIAALVASVLLVLTLFMTWVTITGGGSTKNYNGLLLSSEDGGIYPRLTALFGLVSAITLIFVRSPKVRSICGIVCGALAFLCVGYEINFLNENLIESSAGQFINNSFMSSLTGSSISLGTAPGLAVILSVVIIGLNVKLLFDAKKAQTLTA